MVADSRYEISDLGQVRRAANQKLRKPSCTPAGYQVIVISRPKQKHLGVYVHREVMRAFVGPCPDGFQVSHKNGNNTDNRLENLCYETPTKNIQRKSHHGTQTFGESHAASKLTWCEVQTIRRLRASDLKLKEIADHFEISFQQVSRICQNNNWKACPSFVNFET
jgi:hypothetical protein